MSQLTDRIQETTLKLLSLVNVTPGSIEVRDGDDEIAVDITVPDEESGLLIGYHGETLGALQYLVGQMAQRGSQEWRRVVVNINEYRNQREAQLQQMAQNAADRAVATGDEIEMPYLTPAERRIIHLALAERTDVTTFSEGDDRSRRLIIAPKKSENS